MKDKKFNFIDLYAGIGGFRYALESLGGNCKFTAEINEYAANTYWFNHHKSNEEYKIFDMDKIKTMNEKEIKEMVSKSKIDVIAAGFPCQTFSIAGKREGFNSEDTRGTQFFNVLKLVEVLKPKIVFLENVKNLKNHDNENTYKVIKQSLEREGYDIEFSKVLSPMHVGIPQNRERIFIIAKNKEIKGKVDQKDFVINKNLDIKTILDSKYEREFPDHNMKLSELEVKVLNNWSEFVITWLQNRDEDEKSIPTLDLDVVTNKIKPKNITPSYEEIKERTKLFYKKHKTWIDKWLNTTDMGNAKVFTNRSHRKLEWNAGINFLPKETIAQIRVSGVRFKRPNFSPTLVAVVDNPIIYDNSLETWRTMNFKELSKLQSFPSKFKFNNEIPIREVYKQFGNSVNVKLTKEVAKKFTHLL